MYSDDLRILKNSPSAEEIHQVTARFVAANHDLKTNLQFVNTYIQYILPVYSSLKNGLQLEVRRVFYSCIGISNLINQYKLFKNEIYLKTMKDLLVDPTLLTTLIDSSKNNRLEMAQVKSLFFGSKIFNSFEGELVLEKYLELLAKQLVEVCKAGKAQSEYFITYLSIHPIETKSKLFNEFLNESNFPLLCSAIQQMTDSHKRQFLVKGLLPFLESHISIRNVHTGLKILQRVNFKSIETTVAKYLGEVSNVEFQQIVTLSFKIHYTHFSSLLQIWGDEQYIKSTPNTTQEFLTRELIILSNYLSREEKSGISRDRIFLNAITFRLSLNDQRLRDLGIMIARVITNNEVNLIVEDEIIIDKLPNFELTGQIDFAELTLVTSLQNMTLSNKKQSQTIDSDDESDNSDDGNESQDDSDVVFLKDLIVKLNSDRPHAMCKLLTHAIRLVRQKATFKLEIEYYSEELVNVLFGLSNKYDEKGFEELKLNAIVSVIVVNPMVLSQVLKLLFTGDYSIQQRMVILSCISLSARELRGLDDNYIHKPTAEFPTKQIQSRKPSLIDEVDKSKIEEIKDVPDDDGAIIGQGRVTRISSKLSKPKPKQRPNNFSRIAHKFFYPLANGWIEGINVGHYNEMFLKHYLETMELIVNAAYPCHEFENMAELLSEIKKNASSVSIQR